MHFDCYADHELTTTMRAQIAQYRYEVFVRQMGWELPCEAGFEQDEFDAPRAVHVVAFDDEERIIGYGRLLPTTQPYLLQTHFASLVQGGPMPQQQQIWELSRYTAADPQRPGARQDSRVGKQLLLEAIGFAARRGATSFVCCTSVAIERLSQRWGLTMHRMGPPQRLDGYLLVAGQIDFTAKTLEALAPVAEIADVAPAWQIPAALPQTTVAAPLWAATEARVPLMA